MLPSHSHGLRALIEQAAAKKKLKLDVKLEADSFRVLTSLVEEGLGYTLLPPSSVRNEVAERPAGNGCDRKTGADARTDPCVSHRSSRLDCDCACERAAPRRTFRLPRRGPLGHQARLSRCRALAIGLEQNGRGGILIWLQQPCRNCIGQRINLFWIVMVGGCVGRGRRSSIHQTRSVISLLSPLGAFPVLCGYGTILLASAMLAGDRVWKQS